MRIAISKSFAGSVLALGLLMIYQPLVGRTCTTAVISGKATADGRPLLWKNRDTSSSTHNEVVLLEGDGYQALAVVNAGDRRSVWMGVNSAGFCIENSLSRDLGSAERAGTAGTLGQTALDIGTQGASDSVAESTSTETESQESSRQGPGNGRLMRLALQRCATVEDFRRLLEETNITGRTTVANFGVIDAHGGAAMFETSPTGFTVYDANDPEVAPHGYIVRSNFAMTAQELPANPASEDVSELYAGERYLRACRLIDLGRSSSPTHSISLPYVVRSMTRDMADATGQAYPGTVNGSPGGLPPVIDTQRTISRTTTVSAAVFHGVRPGESPELTTMWTILGDPKFSIAVPCWVSVSSVADELTDPRGGEIGEIALTLRDWHLTIDRTGVRARGLPGIWEDVWTVEDRLLEETLQHRERWSSDGYTAQGLTDFHHSAAARAMSVMEQELIEAKQEALSGADLIRVAIYDHSADTALGPKNLLKFLTPANGFQCERLRPEDIRAGGLSDYQVLIMPGGSGSKQAEMLQPTGCEAVRKFVRTGGGYVGICAGSYLASAQYDWSLNLINARVWDRVHWARGTGAVSIDLTGSGAEFFADQPASVEVYYGQGPLLVPGSHPDLPRYEVLATYASEVAQKGAPVGAMRGTHAIIRGEYGSGRVICFSPHPESETGPNSLITSGVNWAVGK